MLKACVMGGHCTATMKFEGGQDRESCKITRQFLWQGIAFFELFVLYDAVLAFSHFEKLEKIPLG